MVSISFISNCLFYLTREKLDSGGKIVNENSPQSKKQLFDNFLTKVCLVDSIAIGFKSESTLYLSTHSPLSAN